MKNTKLVALAMSLALVAAPLAACSSSSSSSSDATDTTGSAATTTSDADAENSEEVVEFFTGTWRAYVETTGETIYGTAGGTENMLDVVCEEDGTCTVTPLENHEDLLTDEGTWTASDTDSVTLHLTDGDITLTVTSNTSLSGDPTDFGIDGFDELLFTLY